jgi:hypothetical protein
MERLLDIQWLERESLGSLRCEMMRLAKHRANARHLEHQPFDNLLTSTFILGHQVPGLTREIEQDCPGLE